MWQRKRRNFRYKIGEMGQFGGDGGGLWDREFWKMPMIGVGILGTFSFSLLNPIVPLQSKALESGSDEGIAALSAVESSVTVSFVAGANSAALKPTTSTGQSARINMQAKVDVKNSGGYAVYLKGNNAQLVGINNNTHTIPSTSAARTYENMDVNTWGYYAAEGTVIPDAATYRAMSTSGSGDKIAENTSKAILAESKDIIVSFATKLNSSVPADSYSNTVIMSVVSNPMQLTLSTISNMQEMTSDICASSSTLETKQLRDMRDGKYYWTTKLADGKCWMTQNLDLDLSTNTALTNADTDLQTAASWTPPYTTATTMSSSTILDSNTGSRSWSLGNYRITSPTTSSDCGLNKSSAASCSGQFTSYTTPTTANNDSLAHYILGNHYQWNAATAGSGGSTTSGQASNSICPKGWKLPEGNSTAVGSWGGLFDAYGTSSSNAASSPLYFVAGGGANQIGYLYYYGGHYGTYASSTPGSDTRAAYFMYFYLGNNVTPSTTGYSASTDGFNPLGNDGRQRRDGRSVRCVSR